MFSDGLQYVVEEIPFLFLERLHVIFICYGFYFLVSIAINFGAFNFNIVSQYIMNMFTQDGCHLLNFSPYVGDQTMFDWDENVECLTRASLLTVSGKRNLSPQTKYCVNGSVY